MLFAFPQMELITLLLTLLALPLLYLLHTLITFWEFKKKLDVIPSKKPDPIFGHTWIFLSPRNRKYILGLINYYINYYNHISDRLPQDPIKPLFTDHRPSK